MRRDPLNPQVRVRIPWGALANTLVKLTFFSRESDNGDLIPLLIPTRARAILRDRMRAARTRPACGYAGEMANGAHKPSPRGRPLTVETVSLFLALLAVVAEAAVAAAVVLFVGSRLSSRVAAWKAAAVEGVGPQALALAFVVAAVATAGSLYFSEVAHFTPCRLCWYQRICMYPLALD